MKQQIRNFGVTWRRWLVPLTCGVVVVCSLWQIATAASQITVGVYLILIILALATTAFFELWHYTERKKSEGIGQTLKQNDGLQTATQSHPTLKHTSTKGDALMETLRRMDEQEAKLVISRLIGTGEAHPGDGLLDCVQHAMRKEGL